MAQTQNIIHNQGNLFYALYLGFAASLLGVSGFESSANFVEEQEKGVFRKTLRNMLIGVAFFNPLIALVVLNSMPFAAIESAKDFLLSDAAYAVGGQLFRYIVVVDAFFVLAGAVLTAYVGVSGLIHRMASDSCLPYFLTDQNKKGSFPKIIISFFLLCSSILLITRGDLLSLAGVYTIAFLGVMTMFGLGNLILKQTRTELKRTYNAPIIAVIVACLATLFGIFGNIRINPNNLTFFEIYFVPSFLLVLLMVYQDYVMRFLLKITKNIPFIHTFLMANFQDLIQGEFVVFVNHIDRLYNILDYVNKNETGWNIILVHCRNWDMKSDKERYNELKAAIPPLQKAGVFPHLNITTEYEEEPFGPQAIDNVAKRLKVHKNRIMIGSIHHFHDFDYDELGGVRIIF